MSNIVKKYRKKNYLTQKELSVKTGVKQSYISQIEHDLITPSIPFLNKLAKIFDICPNELINYFSCIKCYKNGSCNKDCFTNPSTINKESYD